MTPLDVIRNCGEITDHAYEDRILMSWLDTVEGEIQVLVHGIDPDDYVPIARRHDPDAPLSVPAPFDELYVLYLRARCHEANQEAGWYQNLFNLYNAALQEYSRWYRRTHSLPRKNIQTFW